MKDINFDININDYDKVVFGTHEYNCDIPIDTEAINIISQEVEKKIRMFTKVKKYKNSEGEIAIVFIHDTKYILSIDDTTMIMTKNKCNRTLGLLGYIELVE